jgi:hypothetical protein
MRQISAFLLTVYAAVSICIGFLHTDEVVVSGNGQITYKSPVPASARRFHNEGPCLACLFATGHIIQEHEALPHLSLTDRLIPLSPLLEPMSFSVLHSARAPPTLVPVKE